MTTKMLPTAAALGDDQRPNDQRLRTLSTQVSPFGVPMTGDNWLSIHNSITADVPAVVATGYGAAKQAAPPRGVPR